MKNHILKEHVEEGEQECYLLKIEGAYAKEYWLFVDIAKDKSLSSLDTFLRHIWLECCGHMSRFSLGKARKIGSLTIGDQIKHEYDMGTTTECIITVVANSVRPIQKPAVRVLARNEPIEANCVICGSPAELLCHECVWSSENACYCPKCAISHEHDDMMMPLTNSPRNGECGYGGELDVFIFNPEKFL